VLTGLDVAGHNVSLSAAGTGPVPIDLLQLDQLEVSRFRLYRVLDHAVKGVPSSVVCR
jgi:hypothetical protein